MAILETKKLTYVYSVATPFEKVAIDNISLKVEKGETLAIIGHTGSGKSTLIQHLNALLRASSGEVLLNGENVWADKSKLRQVRFKVGLCFQYPEYQLFEENVQKEIAFGPKQMGLSQSEVESRVLSSLELVGLPKDYLTKSPFDLSGGEKRRVALASIIAMQPDVLILDEPAAGLDPRGRDTVLSLIEQYKAKMGTTVILVSHNMEEVARLADKVFVINKSKQSLYGTVDEVFSNVTQLEEMGLSVPQVTKIFLALRSRGVPCSTSVYTVAQAVAEIQRLRNGAGGAQND